MYGILLLATALVGGFFGYLKYRAYLKSIDKVIEKLGVPGLKAAASIAKPTATPLPSVRSLKGPKEPPSQTAA
ncbi:hypothetical protein SAMN05216377_12281 [Pseudonocardia oroxyli]|uniref:Uncharacterized protein n=2 Tax=Pseudonocardia oroxyli TaxID=366584 RepID=A0A1G8CF58_PSEOR|nr:hypothetical protein SAMN05216377_12281 [Pseudonocardia oroxyli]